MPPCLNPKPQTQESEGHLDDSAMRPSVFRSTMAMSLPPTLKKAIDGG